MAAVAKLMQNLVPDPWRDKEGFSQDIEFASREMLGEPGRIIDPAPIEERRTR